MRKCWQALACAICGQRVALVAKGAAIHAHVDSAASSLSLYNVVLYVPSCHEVRDYPREQVYYFPRGAASLGDHPGAFAALAVAGVATSFTSTLMFTALGTFYNRISDPDMGGAYLTLLNTIANMGVLAQQRQIFRALIMLTLAPGLAKGSEKNLKITYTKSQNLAMGIAFAFVVAQWMTPFAFVKLLPIKNSRQTCHPARLAKNCYQVRSMTPYLRWCDPSQAADTQAGGPGFGVRLRLPGYPPTFALKDRKRGGSFETPHASCQFHLARAQA